MHDAQVGRVLVAALHQAITDELPTRIDFYAHWLRGERLRDGGVQLAPMTAVLGFLRAEGQPYHLVMRRAGAFAADWTYAAIPAIRRQWLSMLPRWWRSRAVLALAAKAIRDGYPTSRAVVAVRRGQARIEIQHSLFCRVREAQASAQCDYHAALISGLLAAFDLPAVGVIEGCSGAGAGGCVVTVDLTGPALPVEVVS